MRTGNLFPWLILTSAILSAPFLCAQDAPAPLPPITRAEVWQAVTIELHHRRGFGAEQLPRVEDVELPVAVPATPGRSLAVAMACWDAELRRAQFQLQCREKGQCVAFLAYAAAGRSTAMAFETLAACRAASRPRSTPHKAAVRVGDHATVIFRSRRLRLVAPVTCLDRGAEGDIIRVRSQDGRAFRARVSAPGLLDALPQ